jgi:hypothetical protein
MEIADEVPDQAGALLKRIESDGLASPLARSLHIIDCRYQFGICRRQAASW